MKKLPVIQSTLRTVARHLGKHATTTQFGASLARGATRVVQVMKDGLQSRHWPARPESLNFEITAICDSKCIHCPRQEMERTMRTMKFDLFKKMIDEAAEMKIPELCPNGFGEILTIRDLDPYFDYIRAKAHDFRININTNGFRLTDEKIELFIRSRVDLLNITLDGATPETFEAIRPQLKLEAIEDNIKRLLRIRKIRNSEFPKVRVGMIVMRQNEHEVQMLLDKWRPLVDFVGVGGFTNRAGGLDTTEFTTLANVGKEAPPSTGACVLPFREMNIWADGKAVLCCDDWNEEEIVGDLAKESLQAIWHGTALKRIRDLHLEKRGGEIGICKSCSYWREPSEGVRLWS